MSQRQAYNEPTKATAIDGEVVLDGPDGVAVSLTPEAAEESAARMLAAAAEARLQNPGQADAAAP